MKIIYGPKGTGKTKIAIDGANKAAEESKGHVVFITDTSRYSFDIKYTVRVINVVDFDVKCESALKGFIKGLVAANADNEVFYVDGIARITEKPLSELGDFFAAIEKLEKDFSVKFVFTISSDLAGLPEFLKKCI